MHLLTLFFYLYRCPLAPKEDPKRSKILQKEEEKQFNTTCQILCSSRMQQTHQDKPRSLPVSFPKK